MGMGVSDTTGEDVNVVTAVFVGDGTFVSVGCGDIVGVFVFVGATVCVGTRVWVGVSDGGNT